MTNPVSSPLPDAAGPSSLSGGGVEIALLLYPGAQMAAVLGLSDLFRVAARVAAGVAGRDPPALQVRHWRVGEDGAAPRCDGDRPPPAAGRPAVVILPPSLEGVPAPALIRAVAPWLVARHDEGAILASVCAGAFLLAGTGLLDGRPATTHWRHAPVLSARFPGVLVVADRLIVDDGDVVTAGGVMAWTDLGLTLVARFLGPAVMLETARLLVIDPPGRDQRSYRHFVAPRDHGDAAILAAQHRLEDWSAAVPSIALLARIAGLGDRTFLRRFQRATGLSPRDYSQNVRIGRARTLLELGRDPVDAVAWQVGYQDPAAFRKIFRRITGLGPADYRRRFGVAPAPPGEGT